MRTKELNGSFFETVPTVLMYNSKDGRLHQKTKTRLKPVIKKAGVNHQILFLKGYQDETITGGQCGGYNAECGMFCECFTVNMENEKIRPERRNQ